MRNMSFAMTTEQFLARTKTVTRRIGWAFLKPGDLVQGVKKAMGLKKVEKIEKLGVIRVIKVSREPLCDITQADCIREGFPKDTPEMFIQMLCYHYGIKRDKIFTRIEFEHVLGGKGSVKA